MIFPGHPRQMPGYYLDQATATSFRILSISLIFSRYFNFWREVDLPTAVSLSTTVVILWKNAYFKHLLETRILYSFSNPIDVKHNWSLNVRCSFYLLQSIYSYWQSSSVTFLYEKLRRNLSSSVCCCTRHSQNLKMNTKNLLQNLTVFQTQNHFTQIILLSVTASEKYNKMFKKLTFCE